MKNLLKKLLFVITIIAVIVAASFVLGEDVFSVMVNMVIIFIILIFVIGALVQWIAFAIGKSISRWYYPNQRPEPFANGFSSGVACTVMLILAVTIAVPNYSASYQLRAEKIEFSRIVNTTDPDLIANGNVSDRGQSFDLDYGGQLDKVIESRDKWLYDHNMIKAGGWYSNLIFAFPCIYISKSLVPKWTQ